MTAPTDPLHQALAAIGAAVTRVEPRDAGSAEALAELGTALERARAALARLERGGARREIERKYLLRALPPAASAVAPRRLEQGYLPGERLVERLRRVEEPDGRVRCFRTVKAGEGVTRMELEEETDPALFAALWPLTAGRRVLKERHVVPDAGHAWEIDRFTDRELVLAEVELAREEERPPLPDWLAPHVVREVTGEAAYVNAVLAR